MTSKRLKNFKLTRVLRKVTAGATIVALTTFGSPSSIMAQQQGQMQEGHWATAAIGLTQGIFQSVIQARQQFAAQQQQIQMMNSLAPQTVSAKFFPQCMVPAGGSATVGNVCEGGDFNSMGLFQSFVQLADTYEQHYNQMLSKAQHSPVPVGLQCLDTERKRMMSAMQRRQNTLQTLMGRLRKEEQAFRDRNAERLRQMDSNYALLHGTQNAERTTPIDNETLTRDFAQFYSPQCQSVIGQNNLSAAASTGLVGIQARTTEMNVSAAAYRNDESSMRREFDQTVQRLVRDLSTQGLDDVLRTFQALGAEEALGRYQTGNDQISAVNQVVEQRARDIMISRERIQEDLNNLLGSGTFQIPSIGSNFSQDFGRFINNAEEFFKKDFINECVAGPGALALSPREILRSIQHRPTNNSGTTHQNYRNALENILNSDAFIDDKLLQIRQLDQQYRNEITITYRDDGSRTVTETPYQLYQKLIANCEQSFYQDNTYRPGSTTVGSASRSQDIQRARNLMNEFKNKVDTFPSELEKELTNRVLNCGGRSIASNACSDTSIMSPSSPNFCFPHANTCSNQVMSCHQEAFEVVEQKKNQIKAEAAIFNQEAEALIATQEGILQQIVAAVISDAEFLSQYFPGADFVYPGDLFVAMPEMINRNGEQLRGGGNISFDDLIAKVTSMKKALSDQADLINGEVNEYMAEVTRGIEQNKQKWAGIKQKCQASYGQLAQQAQQANQQGQQAQAEQDSAVGEFCDRFEGLRGSQNPMAGCTGTYSASSLSEDMSKIAAQLDPNVRHAVRSYAHICSQVQSEREAGTEGGNNNGQIDVAELCRGGSHEAANNLVIAQIVNTIPSNHQSKRENIRRFLQGQSDHGLSEDFLNNDLYGIQLRTQRSRLAFSESVTLPGVDSIDAEIRRYYSETQPGVCAHLANNLASQELTESNYRARINSAASSYNSNLNGTMRSIASTDGGNNNLNQEWQNIGENARRAACRAQANAGRNGMNIGGLNIPMPSAEAFQNLGLGR